MWRSKAAWMWILFHLGQGVNLLFLGMKFQSGWIIKVWGLHQSVQSWIRVDLLIISGSDLRCVLFLLSLNTSCMAQKKILIIFCANWASMEKSGLRQWIMHWNPFFQLCRTIFGYAISHLMNAISIFGVRIFTLILKLQLDSLAQRWKWSSVGSI